MMAKKKHKQKPAANLSTSDDSDLNKKETDKNSSVNASFQAEKWSWLSKVQGLWQKNLELCDLLLLWLPHL